MMGCEDAREVRSRERVQPSRVAPVFAHRILVVEDNAADAGLVLESLDGIAGYHFDVGFATTMAEALEAVREPPDAILLDLNLPDSRGLDSLEALACAVPHTPVIVVTGLDTAPLRERALRLGAQTVITKREVTGPLFPLAVLHVTERRRALQQHEQLQRVLEATPDAILVANHGGQVRYVNRAALSLFAVSEADLLEQPLSFSVRDDAHAEVTICGAGGNRTCEMRVAPVEWNGEAAYLASLRDITERRELETLSLKLERENRQIQEISRLKSRFLASMSHELRTPLNAIIGFSELLVDGRVSPEDPVHREFLGHILTGGRHLLQLVNDVLDLAKVEAGRLELRPEPVELSKVVSETCNVLGPVLRKKEIEVARVLDPALERLTIDLRCLKQILYNYLSNALKFTAPGGRVVIRGVVESEQSFRIEVEDDGIGIEPSDLGRLFREFERVEHVGEQPGGTGLGLALTKQLVEAQGGTVGARSSKGAGSLFYATLPRAPLTPQLSPHHEHSPSPFFAREKA